MQAKNRGFMKKYIVIMLSFTALLLLVFSSFGLAPIRALALNVRGASLNQLLFFDDFSHGSRRWSPQLGMWKVCSGSIDKTEYCAKASVENFSMADKFTFSNYSVQADALYTQPISLNSILAVLGRVKDSSHYYEFELTCDEFGMEWNIVLHNGSSVVYIASGGYNWMANIRYTLRLDMNGSILTASLSTDGGKTYKLLGSGTDTTYTSGKIGLRTFGTGKFDNVTASSN